MQTPENKPTSVTTIIRFGTSEAVQALFGAVLKEKVAVSLWRKRNFSKAWKVRGENKSWGLLVDVLDLI